MRARWMLLALPLFVACTTTPESPAEQTLRGRLLVEFERQEFMECRTGTLFTVRNADFLAGHPDARRFDPRGHVEVTGDVAQPGKPGPAGVTGGVLSLASVKVMPPDAVACPPADTITP